MKIEVGTKVTSVASGQPGEVTAVTNRKVTVKFEDGSELTGKRSEFKAVTPEADPNAPAKTNKGVVPSKYTAAYKRNATAKTVGGNASFDKDDEVAQLLRGGNEDFLFSTLHNELTSAGMDAKRSARRAVGQVLPSMWDLPTQFA